MSDKLKPCDVACCPFCQSTDIGLRSLTNKRGERFNTGYTQCADCESQWMNPKPYLNNRAQPEAVTNAGDVEKTADVLRVWEAYVNNPKKFSWGRGDIQPLMHHINLQTIELHRANTRIATAEADLVKARDIIAELEAKFGPMLKEIEARGYRNDFSPQYAALQSARDFTKGK